MRCLFLQFVIFLSISMTAQGWQRHFHLPNTLNTAAKTIYEINPGNYIALGTCLDTSNGGYSNKLCVMGLGNHGQLLWTKKYGDYKLMYLENSFVSRWGYKQGNALFYTSDARDTNNKQVGVLVKLNLNGDTLWQKVFRDSSEDFIPQRVTGSVDGGLLLTGFFQNWTTGARPFLIVKTDINGNELWRRKIHKVFPDVMDGRAILQDSVSKKIIAVGYQYIGNSNYWRSYDNIMILDSLGNQPVQLHYTPMGGYLQDIIQTKDKKFVAVGAKTFTVDGYGDDVTHSYAVKLDIDNPLSPIWSKEGSSHAFGQYNCMAELADENLLMAGEIDTVPDHLITYIDKRDKYGNLLVSNFYDFSGNPLNVSNEQYILCLNPTSDGGRVAAVEDLNTNYNPYIFVKLDSLGCDSTLAYCAMVAAGIKTLKLSDNIASVYPNPFRDQLTIETEQMDKYAAALYDVSGREIQQLPLQYNQTILNTKNLQNGLYVLKLKDLKSGQQFQVKVIRQD